jgi:hypothetical protein
LKIRFKPSRRASLLWAIDDLKSKRDIAAQSVAVLDLSTKEIVGYALSQTPDAKLAN